MRQRKRRSHEDWCTLIAQQEAEEESIAGFCRKRGLALHSFYHHKHLQRERAASVGFREVSLPIQPGLQVVIEGDTCRIEVQRGFDADCLRQVVEALR